MSHLFPAAILSEARDQFSLRARFVFLPAGVILENGVVEISQERITAVHDRADFKAVDLGNSALIPGLVNAHTHLELSDAKFPIQPPQPFTHWLKGVMGHRRQRTLVPLADQQAVAAGRAESQTAGTTTLGDIAGQTPTPDELNALPRTVSFLEVLGLSPDRRAAQMERARQHLASLPPSGRGLSPHAPYSIHPDLFRDVMDLACAEQVPVAMHVAETLAERELLATGRGEFADFLRDLGVWRSDAIPLGSKPLDALRELSRGARSLVIHGNYLDEEEIDFLATQSQMTVVYCPRTHAFFGHAPHPWQKLLSRGIRVAIGTDSRASNPDLSLFEELKFLQQLAPDLHVGEILDLGTIQGAVALGLETETGDLTVGKSADLAVVSLAESNGVTPQRLFDPGSRIIGTMCRGNFSIPSKRH